MTASETLFETVYISRNLPTVRVSPIKRIANMVTGTVAVLAVVLATAMPAQADRNGDDLAKALAAAIALGLIVNGIEKNKRHRNPPPAPIDHPRPYPLPHPEPYPEPAHKPRIPAVCAIEFEGAQRTVIVFPKSCLRAEGFDYRLPKHCARTARIYGRTDTVYGERCLREAGFRIGRNNHY